MADVTPPLLIGGDHRQAPSGPSRRQGAHQFLWSAPTPSMEEIAELEVQFPSIIQLPSEAIDSEIKDWSASGMIVRSLSRWVPPEAIVREFRRVGLAGQISSISLSHRTALMKFEDSVARDAALSQPWVVNGQPLAAIPWHPDFVPADDALTSALLWIRLPNLPIEYWSDDALCSILSVAGQFVSADGSTKERRRGSFARACVRVDLLHPLRPGARIRGKGSPFWQQFAYEHVEGICSHCGSLHLSGPCSSSQAPASSTSAPRYGPWMAALRNRIPSSASGSGSRSIPSSSSAHDKPASQELEDGWMLPGKTSRRRAVPSSTDRNVSVVGSGSSAAPGSSTIPDSSSPCQPVFSVPVTVAKIDTPLCIIPRKSKSSRKVADSPRKSHQLTNMRSQDPCQKTVFKFSTKAFNQG